MAASDPIKVRVRVRVRVEVPLILFSEDKTGELDNRTNSVPGLPLFILRGVVATPGTSLEGLLDGSFEGLLDGSFEGLLDGSFEGSGGLILAIHASAGGGGGEVEDPMPPPISLEGLLDGSLAGLLEDPMPPPISFVGVCDAELMLTLLSRGGPSPSKTSTTIRANGG